MRSPGYIPRRNQGDEKLWAGTHAAGCLRNGREELVPWLRRGNGRRALGNAVANLTLHAPIRLGKKEFEKPIADNGATLEVKISQKSF